MGQRGFALGTMNRIAFVSGASRGIGLAIAKRLADENYSLGLTYNSSAPAELKNAKYKFYKCDVTLQNEIEEAFSDLEANFGTCDTLICAAGINKDQLLLSMDESHWDQVIDANLKSNFYLVKRAIPKMIRNRFGRIIFISSVVAFSGSPGQSNYAASKAALVGFARSLARELASRNITVNVVAPGAIETDMLGATNEKRLEHLKSMIPLGRFGQPDDVASLVSYLANQESSYITGAVIPVDGGLSMGL
jgi:3-oxoacyl-[acyl-carrier protein] reductase